METEYGFGARLTRPGPPASVGRMRSIARLGVREDTRGVESTAVRDYTSKDFGRGTVGPWCRREFDGKIWVARLRGATTENYIFVIGKNRAQREWHVEASRQR